MTGTGTWSGSRFREGNIKAFFSDFKGIFCRIDLYDNNYDADFAVDAFGDRDRAFIAELNMTNSSLTR